MSWTTKTFTKSADFVFRQIAGESILVPIRNKLNDVQNLYVLNETAAALWSRIDGKRTTSQIIQDFTKEFDVAPKQLEEDFQSLSNDLLDIRAIEEIAV